MTYDLYWNGNASLPKFYRQAYEMQREREDTNAWKQGKYVYDALCFVSPLLHAFAKNGVTAQPYLKEPYYVAYRNSQIKPEQKENERTPEEIQAINASARFSVFASQWNKQFKGKEGIDGSNN